MNKNWLSYLLLALIAFQSVWATADIGQYHEFHELGSQPYESNIQTAPVDRVFAELSNVEQSGSEQPVGDSTEYHHCCHCHQVGLQAGIVAQPPISARLLYSGYEKNTPASPVTALFRPPRI